MADLNDYQVPVMTPELLDKVQDVDVAFGGGYRYLPSQDRIPENIEQSLYYKLANALFFGEKIPDEVNRNLVLRPEYNSRKDKIHPLIASILRSFQPNHEHKMAGTATLLQAMFRDIRE